jgi:hypothetical protein
MAPVKKSQVVDSTPFTASITEITRDGKVKIEFSKLVLVPEPFKYFTNQTETRKLA